MTSAGLKRDWPLTIVTIAMMKVDDDQEDLIDKDDYNDMDHL